MKNKFINTLSVVTGRLFAASYKLGSPAVPLTNRLLDSYIGLRRMLPRPQLAGSHFPLDNHAGNHRGSNKAPYRATQGKRPVRGLPSGV